MPLWEPPFWSQASTKSLKKQMVRQHAVVACIPLCSLRVAQRSLLKTSTRNCRQFCPPDKFSRMCCKHALLIRTDWHSSWISTKNLRLCGRASESRTNQCKSVARSRLKTSHGSYLLFLKLSWTQRTPSKSWSSSTWSSKRLSLIYLSMFFVRSLKKVMLRIWWQHIWRTKWS